LINTYDNTIVYTDQFLDQTISLLEKYETTHDTAMLYLSDHGESLGENGFYLHGVPYFIAPDEQKHVPMILWLSPSFQKNTGLNIACLKQNASDASYSHDYFFHSVLGLFSIKTKEHNEQLDIFHGCRNVACAQAGESNAIVADI